MRALFGATFYRLPRPLRLGFLIIFMGLPLILSQYFTKDGHQSERLMDLFTKVIGHD